MRPAIAVLCLLLPGAAYAQDERVDEAPPGEEVAPPPEEPRQPLEDAGAAAPGAVDRLFRVIRSEPTIQEVQRLALRYYDLEPERVDGLVARAHVKGLIPEIEGSFETSLGDNYTNTRDGLYPLLPQVPENPNPSNYRERVQGASSMNLFRVRAVWSLDRLIFNSEALDARSLNSLGENLVREVTTLYFARRRLLAGLFLQPPEGDLELFNELMRLDELTSTLDALTGGRFARRAWRWGDREGRPAGRGRR
jgi:hypothetical protein